jgi:hypothetical protein
MTGAGALRERRPVSSFLGYCHGNRPTVVSVSSPTPQPQCLDHLLLSVECDLQHVELERPSQKLSFVVDATATNRCNCACIRSGHRRLLLLLFKLFYGSSSCCLCVSLVILAASPSSFFVGLNPRGEWFGNILSTSRT